MIRFLFLSSKFSVSQNTKHKQIANRDSQIAGGWDASGIRMNVLTDQTEHTVTKPFPIVFMSS